MTLHIPRAQDDAPWQARRPEVVAGAFRWGKRPSCARGPQAGTIDAGDIQALRVQASTVRPSIRVVNMPEALARTASVNA